MKIDELEQHMHDRIPLTAAMGMRVLALDETALTLGASLGPNINDKGTAFAGSISALLTLSGWALLHAVLDADKRDLRIAATESHVTYAQPVANGFRAVCAHPGPDQIARLNSELEQRGKARIALAARLLEGEVLCAEYTGVYDVRPQEIV